MAWEAVRSDKLGGREKHALLSEWDAVLQLGLAEARVAPVESDAELDALVRERDAARAAKNWKRADEIRNLFKERGILIEDSPQGSRWRRG